MVSTFDLRWHVLLACAALAAGAGCSDNATSPTESGGESGQPGTAGSSEVGGNGGSSVSMPDGSMAMQQGGMAGNALDAAADANRSADSGLEAGPATYNHRALVSTARGGTMAIVADDGTYEWQYDYSALGGEANDAWLLPNGDVVFPYINGVQELTRDKKVVWNYPAPAGTEIHGCHPLPNGHFLVGENHSGGIAYLHDLDEMGHVTSSIKVDSGNASYGPHNQFRNVRKTPQGTYLVTYMDLDRGREIDDTGKMVREFPCGRFVALRLPDGNTLLACGDDHRVIEVDPQNKIVWEANETNVPEHLLSGFACGPQRLPSGNTVICSWPGHLPTDPKSPRCFEVTPDHQVAWKLKIPDPGWWITNIELLDPAAKVQGVVLR
jgi:hypothetical protein